MGKARDFKFGVRINRQAHKPENGKVGQKGRGLRNVTYFYNYGTLIVYGTGLARDFRFGEQIDH